MPLQDTGTVKTPRGTDLPPYVARSDAFASRFAHFALPDGRSISVRPSAVTAVYDQEGSPHGAWLSHDDPRIPDDGVTHPVNHRSEVWVSSVQPSTVIAIGQTNLVVPYTHDEVMALLWPS